MTVKGTVVRLLPSRPVITQLDFTCGKCGAVQSMVYPVGRVVHPTQCTSAACRARAFQVCKPWGVPTLMVAIVPLRLLTRDTSPPATKAGLRWRPVAWDQLWCTRALTQGSYGGASGQCL